MAQEQTQAISMSDGESAGTEVQLKDIQKTFNEGQVVACEDITLDIETEEFVVFLGPSGCGKTTTLRCIAGLEQPDDGQILIGDEDVTYHKPKDRDLAFVFQNIALFPNKTVRGNIRFGLDMKTDLSGEEKNDRVAEVARMLNIEELLDRTPDQLSGGQQQRVSLGRAMVMEPAVFLLDEPFSALDAQLRNRMRTEVKRLQRELNTAMVFVTHDQEEAMTLGDKILIMDDGRIQQVGSPYEIYNNPENLFVADFIGSPSVNKLQCEVTGVGDSIDISTELFEMSIDGDQSPSVAVSEGDALTFAVRPEYLRLEDRASLFDAAVEIVEPHGDRDAVFLRSEEIDLAAIVNQGQVDATREVVSVDINEENVWLFAEDGERIV
jgi:multiple sugar transport system ATP-binding protein